VMALAFYVPESHFPLLSSPETVERIPVQLPQYQPCPGLSVIASLKPVAWEVFSISLVRSSGSPRTA
jgi:hypothetical protein